MALDEPLRSSCRIRIAPAPAPANADAAEVEALLTRLETITDLRERAELLVRIAIILRDALGDPRQAVDALLEAWASDPTNDAVLDHLEPLLRREGRFAEALETTRALFSRERDTARALALAEAIVRWLTREVPDPDLARQWVERVRALDSTHSLVHLVRAGVAREHGDAKGEIDELDRAVLAARRPDDRARIHLMMAARYLEDRLFSRTQAKKHYAAANKLFPRTMEPLRGLEALAVVEEDKVALADVLRKQSGADIEERARLDILLRLATIEEEEFCRPELAAQTLERVLVIDPLHAEAQEALERCYNAARLWPQLCAVLERAAISDTDAATRAMKLQKLGDILESKLGDVGAALETYRRLVSLMPEDEMIVGELARLAEKVSDVELAVNCRERLSELTDDLATRARHQVIAGQLLMPVDAALARRHFERAALADASNSAAWNALLWDARTDGDTARAARYLEERARATEMPHARASYFVELAELHTKTGDVVAAHRAYEEALLSDPNNDRAAAVLFEVFEVEERFEEAERAAAVVAAAAERDQDTNILFAARRAQTRIAIARGRPDLALGFALAAHEIRPDDPEALDAFLFAASDMRADPQVVEARAALVAIADTPDHLARYSRIALAETLALLGENDRAAVLFDDVLSETPDDERALAGLSQHYTATGDTIAALGLRQRLARRIASPSERHQARLEMAEEATRAGSDELAAEIYEEARRERPGDLPLLHKLVGAYQRVEKWASVFEVLRSIADVDVDPGRKAKTLFTMAQIANAKLLDRKTAIALFDESLDVDASRLEAFERIARLLTETKDWAGLDQMYQRMITRALGGQDTRLQHALYKQIGVLYRDRIGDVTLATHAFRAAAQLRPDDEEAQAMLREILARSGRTSGAVTVTLERILRDPSDLRAYPALFDLLASRPQGRDRALCVASAMNLLDVAHPAAEGLRASFPQLPLEGIVLDLGVEGYRELLHPEMDPALTEIFEVVAPALVEILLARLGFRERLGHPGPPLKGEAALTDLAGRAARILGAPSPKLHLRRTPGQALAAATTRPPSLLVYPPGLGGVARDVLTFVMAKRIFEITPPLLARALCPSMTELKALASSAVRIATGHDEPADAPLRERLDRDATSRLAAAVRDALGRDGDKLDVRRWSELADVSASRAGLLLVGDLAVARAAIAIEPQAPIDLAPREKMKELLVWFLGDDCAALRLRLGVALA